MSFKYYKLGFLSFVVLSCLIISCNQDKPRILIIGDSISAGYTPYVKSQLHKEALVFHINENAQHTQYGLDNIKRWIGNNHWDLIQFNWGHWDLCYRATSTSSVGKKDKFNGIQQSTLDVYKKNLDSLVLILKTTKAKLVFVTTTYVPEKEAGMFHDDVLVYNNAAKEVMRKHSIEVFDIYLESKEIHNKYRKDTNSVHYTRKGYKELAKLISVKLEKELIKNY